MEIGYFDSYVAWYSERKPIYESLSKKVSEILEEIFFDLKINYYNIEWRAKTVESFRGKLIKGLEYDPKQMKDLAGIRVIVYVHSDLHNVRDVIKSIFDIKEYKNKSETLGTDRVGYRSEHFIAVLPSDRIKLAEYKKFEGFLFEIQIRTILEHSWAEIEHDRNYKFSGILPQEIKRRFSLLSAALESADNEFENISQSIDALRKEVSDKTKAGKIDIQIDSISLRQYLNDKFEHLHGLKASFGESRDYSGELIQELNEMGIKTLKDLDAIIPLDYIDKHNEIHFQNNYETNFLGLVRDLLILKYKELYFERAWHRSWVAIGEESIDMYKKYNIDIDYLMKKYDLKGPNDFLE